MTAVAHPSTALLWERSRSLLAPQGARAAAPGQLGLEIELTPIRLGTYPPRPVPPAEVAAALAPDPAFAAQARFSFEPGGQLELSPVCAASPAICLETAEQLVGRARQLTGHAGIGLLDCAVHPWLGVDDVPLQCTTPRYSAMQEHFDSVGHSGRQMMRLTGALQVCVDADAALLRWRALNLLGPALAAAFAASPLLAGAPSGVAGTRNHIWQGVDPARTAFDCAHLGCDAVSAYTDFALGAAVLAHPRADDSGNPFSGPLRDWLARDGARPDADDIEHHFSTLFPPVRPRGYLEVRYLDALPARWRRVAVCVLAALSVDEATLWRALDAAPSWDWASTAAWARSAHLGVGDQSLRATATDLLDLAATSARRCPPGWLPAGAAGWITDFAERFTRVGRAPADELLECFTADPEDLSTWT